MKFKLEGWLGGRINDQSQGCEVGCMLGCVNGRAEGGPLGSEDGYLYVRTSGGPATGLERRLAAWLCGRTSVGRYKTMAGNRLADFLAALTDRGLATRL